jgi:glycerol-3-phosphate acyltransferase PlsY
MVTAFLFVAAYLLGSIPSGLIVGRLGKGIDIREHGSGNLGATNAFRTLGIASGTIVIVADILKGTIAASLPYFFIEPKVTPLALLMGVAAVIGHIYPVFAGFKGGKAVATSAGVLLFYSPLLFITMIGVFFLLLYLTKYVSLSSMLAGIYAVIYSLFTGDVFLIIIVCALTLAVIYRHRLNIKRILNKTEPKITWL